MCVCVCVYVTTIEEREAINLRNSKGIHVRGLREEWERRKLYYNFENKIIRKKIFIFM